MTVSNSGKTITIVQVRTFTMVPGLNHGGDTLSSPHLTGLCASVTCELPSEPLWSRLVGVVKLVAGSMICMQQRFIAGFASHNAHYDLDCLLKLLMFARMHPLRSVDV